VQLEGFVDFACFVWGPLQLVFSLTTQWPVLLATPAFIGAGGYRLARFNTEGMTAGGYLGLPVTYTGVVVPAAALLASTQLVGALGFMLAGILIALSLLMTSRRFVVPRVSV
jgi:phosphatidylserine synthase